MPITEQQLITRAVREARAGLSEEEARIYEDVGKLHVTDALQMLARSCEHDQKRRVILSKRFTFRAADNPQQGEGGVQVFVLSDAPQMWLEGLRYASVYPMQGEAEVDGTLAPFVPLPMSLPMQWEANPTLGHARGTNTMTGTFWIENGYLFSVAPPSSTLDYLSVTTVCIPDFSENYPVPTELESQLVAYLAIMLAPAQPAAEAKNASADK